MIVYFRTQPDNSLLPPCHPSISALDTEWGGGLYRANNTQTNDVCGRNRFEGEANYWIAENGLTNQRLLMDQCYKRPFSRVLLRNAPTVDQMMTVLKKKKIATKLEKGFLWFCL